jgi:hypothetical protein
MSVQIIRELKDYNGRACLVRKGEEYFVVSSVSVLGTPETLVFRADAEGDITEWLEVAGGKHMSREEAIVDLGHLA